MDILLIGGTGIISTAVTELLLRRGDNVYLLNRGKRENPFAGKARQIVADKTDRAGMKKALEGLKFDAVANFIAFNADDVAKDVETFAGMTKQYLLISSASAYQKPPTHYIVTESTPLHNPYWGYSRNKIAMEDAAVTAYREKGFPVTIVRPSYTYGEFGVPGVFGLSFQHFERIKKGKPLIVHGDGQSLWQMTFNEEFARGFAGLIGNARALGEAFHITSDEVLTWDQIFQAMGRAIGIEPKLVHIPAEFLGRAEPSMYDGLKGDMSYSIMLDNSKIKNVVPDFRASTTFYEGMRRCLAWWAKHPDAHLATAPNSEKVDRVLALWEKALALAEPQKSL